MAARDQNSISAAQVYSRFTQKSNHSNNSILILQVILVYNSGNIRKQFRLLWVTAENLTLRKLLIVHAICFITDNRLLQSVNK